MLEVQEKIGVTCIYQAEYLIQRRRFCVQNIQLINDDLYKDIDDSWSRYRKNIDNR